MRGGLNLYGYANSDPVNFRDPSGLIVESVECDLGRSILTCTEGLEALESSGWDVFIFDGPCDRPNWCPSNPAAFPIPVLLEIAEALWRATVRSGASPTQRVEFGTFMLRIQDTAGGPDVYGASPFVRGLASSVPGMGETPVSAIALIHTHPTAIGLTQGLGSFCGAATCGDNNVARRRGVWVITVSQHNIHFIRPDGSSAGPPQPRR